MGGSADIHIEVDYEWASSIHQPDKPPWSFMLYRFMERDVLIQSEEMTPCKQTIRPLGLAEMSLSHGVGRYFKTECPRRGPRPAGDRTKRAERKARRSSPATVDELSGAADAEGCVDLDANVEEGIVADAAADPTGGLIPDELAVIGFTTHRIQKTSPTDTRYAFLVTVSN